MTTSSEFLYRMLSAAFFHERITDFKPHEFIKPTAGYPPVQNLLHIVPTAKVLQALRDAGAGPITINSGYRSPDYNEQVGGSPGSQHIEFRAADIVARDWSPDQVANWLEQSTYRQFIGLGRYHTFTHVDTRHWPGNPEEFDRPARWDNRY